MEINSIINQEIKGRFVEREVVACVSLMIEYILSTSYENPEAPLSWDEITNNSYYTDLDGNCYNEQEKTEVLEQWNEKLQEMENQFEHDDCVEDYIQLSREIEYLKDAEQEYYEIYEWWIVSRYLADKLEAQGEVILSDGLNHYWGRCTTGQAILLDAVISEICRGLEILEGQEHQWKV